MEVDASEFHENLEEKSLGYSLCSVSKSRNITQYSKVTVIYSTMHIVLRNNTEGTFLQIFSSRFNYFKFTQCKIKKGSYSMKNHQYLF